MASRYNVSDSASSDERDIFGEPVTAAATAIDANIFYGRLRQHSPKKSEGQDAKVFSESSSTTVDDSDNDKHYIPPPPSPMKTRSRGSRSRGSSRPRGAVRHTAEVGSDEDMFAESSPQESLRGCVSTRSRAARSRRASRSRGAVSHTAKSRRASRPSGSRIHTAEK